MTLQEILDAVSDEAGSVNLNQSMIIRKLNKECKRLYDKVLDLNPRYYENFLTVTITSGTTEYDILDTDFDRLNWVKKLSTSKDNLPITSENSDTNGFYLTDLNGSYQQIAFTGFGSATSRYLSYFTKFTELASTALTSEPGIPDDLHEALVSWGLFYHFKSPTIKDIGEAINYQQEAEGIEAEYFKRFNPENRGTTELDINLPL